MTNTDPLLTSDLPGLEILSRGKVRDIYAAGDYLLVVTTDRLSAFDVVLDRGIPRKGAVLNQVSAFWFRRLADTQRHHLVTTEVETMAGLVSEAGDAIRAGAAQIEGRSMLVKRLEMLPCECIVRGYLAGSGWRDYQKTGSVCGHALPAGLQNSSRLPEPIFTPSTKAEAGHDVNISRQELWDLVGKEMGLRLEDRSLALYREAAAFAESKGFLLADTKLEFGRDKNGALLVGDEAFTPDSSRYWDIATYAPGQPQASFDKQIVRDYLEGLGWDKTPPPPALPDAIVQQASERYLAIAERLTGTRPG